ncbi:Peroxygenase [Dichanthelium oligosanthes]|uniref:Peroxygenase n=1 Tax=Dichanthelium oligosanthes TaxID=888268 RepID=A0A1E5VQ43_9POAL|nr:Peroxygenase [Dichanthelium oligosanthes]
MCLRSTVKWRQHHRSGKAFSHSAQVATVTRYHFPWQPARSCKLSPRVSMSSSFSSRPEDPSLETEAPHAAVTRERRLNPDLQEQLPKPYLARALEAVDPSHPQGTKGRDHRGLSVLQQHAAFFDRNGDGIIYPWETFQGGMIRQAYQVDSAVVRVMFVPRCFPGLQAIGCGLPVSFMGSILINLVLSYPTQPGWLPSPFLSIHIKNIHKGKHGSDSESYDTEGRFDPSKFDAIFSKYGRTHPDALTLHELTSMLQGNRNMYDFIGWIAAAGEWLLLYSVAKDKDGLLHRETIRGAFDGSLFERLEDNKKSS